MAESITPAIPPIEPEGTPKDSAAEPKPQEPAGRDNQSSVLRFEEVTVAFGAELAAEPPALEKLSFNVRRGETRVILGAAGSGKTVLLKAAMGLIHPVSGKVFLFDEDVTNKAEVQLFDIRCKLGMLFQESALFDSMTVAQNVAYPLLNQKAIQMPREQMEPAVRKSLSFVELEHTMDKYPSELSGGMRRRVAIARAVVTNPPLLLYDSPTAGLDPITAHTIMALIVKERDANNTTGLVVTHRYQDGNLVANFRYNPNSGRLDPAGPEGTNTIFMVMKEGRLVFEGNQTELEASTDSYVMKFVKRPELEAA
jgi:phospholipid/cholesterol/gamma-HCH transport system ATP-binding protein